MRPFVLVGTLFNLKRLDPDYVCPRCQGMDADEGLATFCPQCGDLRKEAVLRKCPKCHHDFLAGLAPEPQPFWGAAPAPTVVASPETRVDSAIGSADALALGAARVGPNGGKLCRTCGQEFESLWRVVVSAYGEPEEWFVCGATPACKPDSLTVPVQV